MPDSQSTPAATVVETPAEAPEAAQETEWLKLDPKNLTQEIRRLQQENSDFLQAFNTEVGNHAARKYQPQLQARERELENERMLRRQLEIAQMPEKDIEAKFAAEPEFAEEYAKLVHYKPPVDNADEQLVAEAFMEELQFAEANKVSPEFIQQVVDKAANGGYAADHWSKSIRQVRQDLVNEVLRTTKGSADSVPTINEAITKGGADVAPASRGAGANAYTFKTVAEFKALPRIEQQKIIAEPEGMKFVEDLMKKG